MSNSKVTKRALVRAFKELLETKPYDRITVTALAQQCGVNRHTFYYHFSSMENLVAWGIGDKMETTVTSMASDDWQAGVVAVLNMLIEDRSFIYRILQSADLVACYRVVRDSARTLLLAAVKPYCEGARVSEQDLMMVVDFYAAGLIEVLITWIYGDMKESPEAFARRVVPLMRAGLRASIDKISA